MRLCGSSLRSCFLGWHTYSPFALLCRSTVRFRDDVLQVERLQNPLLEKLVSQRDSKKGFQSCFLDSIAFLLAVT